MLHQHKKSGAEESDFFNSVADQADWLLDVGCLLALLALRHVKGNLLTLFQCFEAAHVDRGKMRKQILTAIIGCNKPKTFCIVKPFNYTCCHVITSFLKIMG
jgi:hypothetical protein